MDRLGRRSFMGGSAALLAGMWGAAPAAAGPNAAGQEGAGAGFARVASGPLSRVIHSGHSLTDAYIHTGPWPGTFRQLARSMGINNARDNHVTSTIPGSPMHWRWDHAVNDGRPGDPRADARLHIGDFDTLVITEGSPPARADDLDGMANTLEYLGRFASNAIENGNGGQGASDIILWSNWPAIDLWRDDPRNGWDDLPDLGAALHEFGRSYKLMADYTGWQMRQRHAHLPPDWRIWIIPGHLFMARVWQDAPHGRVPGITRIEDLFGDDIHPTGLASYGLACLVLTCLYQMDLRSRPRVHVAEDVSAEQAAYFHDIAWQIATSYEPAGMGGTEGAAAEFDPARDRDPLAG